MMTAAPDFADATPAEGVIRPTNSLASSTNIVRGLTRLGVACGVLQLVNMIADQCGKKKDENEKE